MLGLLLGDAVELGHRLPHPPPGAVEHVGLEPAVIGVEAERAAALGAQDHRQRVDHPLVGRARHRPERRRAVDRDQDRGPIADDDLRWPVDDRDRRGAGLGRGRERRLHPIQRNRALRRRQHLAQLGHVARSLAGQRREVAAGNLDVLQRHRAPDRVDLGARRRPYHAVSRLAAARHAGADRGAKDGAVALPALELRLVDQEAGIGQLDLARPWVRRGRILLGQALGRDQSDDSARGDEQESRARPRCRRRAPDRAMAPADCSAERIIASNPARRRSRPAAWRCPWRRGPSPRRPRCRATRRRPGGCR